MSSVTIQGPVPKGNTLDEMAAEYNQNYVVTINYTGGKNDVHRALGLADLDAMEKNRFFSKRSSLALTI